MANNVAVGILRPPHVFFYEVDCKKGRFMDMRNTLKFYGRRFFNAFSIFRTKHGYHFVGYPYTKRVWRIFKNRFQSDFTIKLRPRWNKKNPQVLRISEKFNLKTGKVKSEKPKFIYGNLFLENIDQWKVLYYAK